jgi:hypothetical protein
MKLQLPILSILIGFAQVVRAATYTFEPEADARIINIPGSGYGPVNYAQDFLSVYTAPGNVQRTLMRFNFGGVLLAPGERVISDSLSLQVSTGFGTSQGRPTEIYRVTRHWTETGLSWLAPDKNLLWNPEGGEYVGENGFPDLNPYASNSELAGNGQQIGWDIASLVDEWLEGAEPNEGLLMLSYNGNGMTFASREGAAGTHPRLVITTGPGVPRLRVEQSGNVQIEPLMARYQCSGA